MIFYGKRTTAQLQFAKPLDICCNCGTDGDNTLVETRMVQTRFFFVFGTQLDVVESFPYCKACRRSANRVRPGLLGQLLMSALTTSVLFLVVVWAESILPLTMRESPFYWSLALGVVGTFAYYRPRPRGHYQPVRLAEAHMLAGRLHGVHLVFANADYCRLFAAANVDARRAGVLQVSAAA